MELKHATDETFQTEVLESPKPVLVDFYADWCGPCKMLAPIVEELAEEFSESLRVIKLNVDEANKIAAAYSVMSIPTLVYFQAGEEVKRTVGYQSKEDLIKTFNLQ